GEKGADRQEPAAERLAEDETVGTNAFVIAGEQGAGAAEARLHLVADEQHTVPRADLARPGEIAGRGHDDASLALDRLDEKSRGVRRDRCFKCRGITERNADEARCERAEAVAVL